MLCTSRARPGEGSQSEQTSGGSWVVSKSYTSYKRASTSFTYFSSSFEHVFHVRLWGQNINQDSYVLSVINSVNL